jgi:hypothetical protein
MTADPCCRDTRCRAPIAAGYVVKVGMDIRATVYTCRWHEIALDRFIAAGGTVAVRPKARGHVGDCP